ncbi:MAG: glycosyltransferase family 4 protein [Lachnospiraceae bacterium]|nr:glycosyltransferase family 4 protein [Lachnospiraceae bacterium]
MSMKSGEFVLFIAGDNFSGTGPAIVTDALIKNAPKNTLYLKSVSKFLRALEIPGKIMKCDAVLFSGFSKQNIYGMNLCRLFHKKSAYLMHGCVEYENEMNRVPDKKMALLERKMMKKTDLILAVSRQFEEWLKEHYPEYRDKTEHLTNGIDWDLMQEKISGEERDLHGIITVGGGMPRKGIVNICRAVEKLIDEGVSDITLTVCGDEGADTKEIDSYPFVKNEGLVSHERLMELYRKNRLFIQNSRFETFGLAPLEALLSQTEILISEKCGALSVIKSYEDSDIIRDTEDIEEIAGKIKDLFLKENHVRLICELDKESTSWQSRARQLLTIMKNLSH